MRRRGSSARARVSAAHLCATRSATPSHRLVNLAFGDIVHDRAKTFIFCLSALGHAQHDDAHPLMETPLPHDPPRRLMY